MNIQGVLLAVIFLSPSLSMAQSSTPPDMSKTNPPARSFVVIDKNKRCTIKILRGRVPNHRERRQLIKYFKAQGCHGGGWSRAKNGKNAKTVFLKG